MLSLTVEGRDVAVIGRVKSAGESEAMRLAVDSLIASIAPATSTDRRARVRIRSRVQDASKLGGRPMQRRRLILYRGLEGDLRHGWPRYLNAALMVLIAANVIAVVIGSIAAVQRDWGDWLVAFELVSVAVFTVEYLVRLWVAVEAKAYSGRWGRLRYALTPMALIDLVAIAPFYLGLWLELDTRFLRVLRLLRVFKLTRYSASMDLLLTVLRQEAAAIGSAMFVMLIIIVLAASGIHLIEGRVQPDAMGSIPKAMWWAAVTLTTVGYGDVVPVTVPGRLFGLLITVAGVGMVALPAGILASGFSQELNKRREAYRRRVKRALEDGTVSRRERAVLERKRRELGVSEEEASAILDAESAGPRSCPHCGKPLTASEPAPPR